MGRPPLGERALTPAEKMRRYRERKFGNKPPRRAEADLEIAQLKARIAELEREVAQLRESLATARLRARQDARPRAAPLPHSVTGWDALKQRAQGERRAKLAAMKAARADEPPLSPSEREELEKASAQIKSLKTRVQNLRVELHHVRGHYDSKIAQAGGMNFQTMSAIAKTLHPDRVPSEAERAEACKLFTAWKADNSGAKRRRGG
jgi:chromosome segregation ATPase